MYNAMMYFSVPQHCFDGDFLNKMTLSYVEIIVY